MSSSSYANQVSVGDEVYGSDGDKVGTVAEVQTGYIVVEKGFFFPTDYYIPASAIASASGGQVYLTTTKDAALNSGWDTVPDVQTTASAATLGTAAATTDTWTDTDRIAAARVAGFEETVIEVPLRSETVDLQKQARVAEEVVISKDAVQRTEQVRGTVRREEVFVDEDAVTDESRIDRSAEGSSRPL